MAETLGSLVDKLTIKNIRLSVIKSGKGRIVGANRKIKIVDQQRKDLIAEIDEFLANAIKRKVRLKELKVKLYSKPTKKQPVRRLGQLIDKLSSKNLELWNLEDEVRRTDVSNAHIVKTKRKIDIANQIRNDLIDEIDTLLEKKTKRRK